MHFDTKKKKKDEYCLEIEICINYTSVMSVEDFRYFL